MAKRLDWNIMKQTLDLDEVMSVLGINVLNRSGNELAARCPLPSHTGADTNPSFAINTDKLAYNCFVCGGGSIAQLVMETQGLEWEEALEWLRPYVGSLAKEDPEMFVQHIKRIMYVDEEQEEATMPYFKESVLAPWIDGPFDYYEGRGIDERTCRALKLGFDSNYTRFDRKNDREWVGGAAIIPHFFEGNLVGYQSRVVETEDNPKPLGIPRFDNTSGFPKADTIYNYDMARRLCGFQHVHVVESALTCAYIMSLGGLAVATFGASVSKEQLNLLRIFPRVVLHFDNDKPGRQATGLCIKALQKFNEVWVLPPVEVEKGDLLDLNRSEAKELMKWRVPGILNEYYLG